MADNISDIMDQRLFKAVREADLSEADIQLAAAVLLFEVSMSDGHVDRMEIAELVEILRKQFNLDGKEIGRILESVRAANGEKLQLDIFTYKLKQFWNEEQRVRLLNNLWVIALADRVIDDRERALIDQIANSLNIDEQSIRNAESVAQELLLMSL